MPYSNSTQPGARDMYYNDLDDPYADYPGGRPAGVPSQGHRGDGGRSGKRLTYGGVLGEHGPSLDEEFDSLFNIRPGDRGRWDREDAVARDQRGPGRAQGGRSHDGFEEMFGGIGDGGSRYGGGGMRDADGGRRVPQGQDHFFEPTDHPSVGYGQVQAQGQRMQDPYAGHSGRQGRLDTFDDLFGGSAHDRGGGNGLSTGRRGGGRGGRTEDPYDEGYGGRMPLDHETRFDEWEGFRSPGLSRMPYGGRLR
ncbi:hypothetical protein LTR78_006503 [Recurvomyces mirabilis]|uniref:Uncharacterized protein n=1 Tax=Recurvomyces mirabilis TaxID=574656 RepID=A0AAE1BZZ1_9PEZI|nr:hypothetical protein LTR78_006503 [Recurvomyces mirabilis]KAK5151079.1 hypothetical protein LTS14_009574 [Recurvomyces mirabilis]